MEIVVLNKNEAEVELGDAHGHTNMGRHCTGADETEGVSVHWYYQLYQLSIKFCIKRFKRQ